MNSTWPDQGMKNKIYHIVETVQKVGKINTPMHDYSLSWFGTDI